jgi:hypothetical protein
LFGSFKFYVTLAEFMNAISIAQDFNFNFQEILGKECLCVKSKTVVKLTGMFRVSGITFTWISIQGKCVEKVLIPSTGMCVGGK